MEIVCRQGFSIRLLGVLGLLALIGCETRSTGPLTTVGTLWIHRPSGAAKYLTKQVDLLAPAIPGNADKDLFQRYQNDGMSVWATNWTSRLDFTGVAWDSPRAGTLIHPPLCAVC